MDAMTKWIEGCLEMVRAGLAPEANDEMRRKGALACSSLHALLSEGWEVPPQGPDLFDALLERLSPFMAERAPGFMPPMVSTKGDK
jgi:hypothetical protein